MKDGDEIHYFPEIQLVTVVLLDFTGRSFTRTMGTTDQLQILMDFYHDMLPAAAGATGIFLYCGERVKGEQTPAGIGMKNWDRIYAVPTVRAKLGLEKQRDVYITLKLVPDNNGCTFYRTMRMNEKLKVLTDLFCTTGANVLAAERSAESVFEGRFIFDGRFLRGDMTPAELGMEDGDEVEYIPYVYG